VVAMMNCNVAKIFVAIIQVGQNIRVIINVIFNSFYLWEEEPWIQRSDEIKVDVGFSGLEIFKLA
jgi:hypothetical protein